MSIRDMSRNVCILTEDAYLDSEDKKTHDYKGVIESSRRAEEIKDFLAAKLYYKMLSYKFSNNKMMEEFEEDFDDNFDSPFSKLSKFKDNDYDEF